MGHAEICEKNTLTGKVSSGTDVSSKIGLEDTFSEKKRNPEIVSAFHKCTA